MARKNGNYSEADQATALALLAANGGNVYKTARELRIPQSTLRKWRDGKGLSRDITHKCEQKKDELHDLFERVSRTYLDRALADEAVNKTSGKDAVIAAATATDKMRLLREQSTSITRTDASKLSDDELDRRIKELEAELAGNP